MSSGEAEYIAAAVACMRASHLRMLGYDFEFLGCTEVGIDITNYEPAHVIIDNEAAIAMGSCNKDTAGNRPEDRKYHYVRQETMLKGYIFHWITTKYQLADPFDKGRRENKV